MFVRFVQISRTFRLIGLYCSITLSVLVDYFNYFGRNGLAIRAFSAGLVDCIDRFGRIS